MRDKRVMVNSSNAAEPGSPLAPPDLCVNFFHRIRQGLDWSHRYKFSLPRMLLRRHCGEELLLSGVRDHNVCENGRPAQTSVMSGVLRGALGECTPQSIDQEQLLFLAN